MRRYLAVLLTFVLVLSSSAVAFAQGQVNVRHYDVSGLTPYPEDGRSESDWKNSLQLSIQDEVIKSGKHGTDNWTIADDYDAFLAGDTSDTEANAQEIFGYITPDEAVEKFRISVDDGIRLYIDKNSNKNFDDNELFLESWKTQGSKTYESSEINLESNNSYKFQIDYFNWGGKGNLKFEAKVEEGWKIVPAPWFSINEVRNELPIITLTGDNPLQLTVGDAFNEPGYTAVDTEDGNITENVVIGGDQVDLNVVGTYTITYTVEDSQGATDTKNRVVNVVESIQNNNLFITVDDYYNIWFNGVHIGDGEVKSGSDLGTGDGDKNWKTVDEYKVTLANKNLIAVKGWDRSNGTATISGLIAKLEDTPDQITDGNWMYTLEKPIEDNSGRKWYELDYTGGNWLPVEVIPNQHYLDHWTDVSDYSLVNDAKWIWSPNFDGSQFDSPVWFRNIINSDNPPVIDDVADADVSASEISSWEAPSTTASDDEDGDISDDIVIVYTSEDSSATVIDLTTTRTHLSTIGNTVKVTYNVDDSAGNSATEVTATFTSVANIDTTPPVIDDVADADVSASEISTWEAPSTTASDDEDGDISDDIEIAYTTDDSGATVTDIATARTHLQTIGNTVTVTYNVDDSAGNSATEVTATFTSVANIDTTPPVIDDVADADVSASEISSWEAPSTTASDDEDGDISDDIVIVYTSEDSSATVIDLTTARTHLSTIGNTVKVTYNVDDSAGNSAPEVTATFTSVADEGEDTAPVITLKGDIIMNLTVGDVFAEPGYTATDNEDGDLTSEVVVAGDTVDTNTVGTYVITYNVRDTGGNVATEVTRTVNVRAADEDDGGDDGNTGGGGGGFTPSNDDSINAVTDNLTTIVNQPVVTDVDELLANDEDADEITSVENGGNGTVSISGDEITFTPTEGFIGRAYYYYTAENDADESDRGTVIVTVEEGAVIEPNETPLGGGNKDEMILINPELVPLGTIDFSDPYIYGYPDDTFRPERPVTRAEIATIVARILKLDLMNTGDAIYNDVHSDDWFYNYIQAVTHLEIFNGYGDGTFKANQPVTHGEMAAIFSKYWELKNVELPDEDMPYNDVEGHWAEDHISRFYNAGVSVGFIDDTFRPNAFTKRSELVVMVNRIIDRPNLEQETPSFTDVSKEFWGYEAIEAATEGFVPLEQ